MCRHSFVVAPLGVLAVLATLGFVSSTPLGAAQIAVGAVVVSAQNFHRSSDTETEFGYHLIEITQRTE